MKTDIFPRGNQKFQSNSDLIEESGLISSKLPISTSNMHSNKPILPPIMPMIQKLQTSSGIEGLQKRKSTKKKKKKEI